MSKQTQALLDDHAMLGMCVWVCFKGVEGKLVMAAAREQSCA